MKLRDAFLGGGPSASVQRGAAPVGFLHELPPVERTAIVCLRAWCEGGDDHQRLAPDFRAVMGNVAGASALRDFDALMTLLLNDARRPIMRHGVGCRCFGGDESAFANMVAAAAGQDRDDALLFAVALLAGQAAWVAVDLAFRVGQVFLRLARVSIHAPGPTHRPLNTNYEH